jgi:hypothetical protein
MKYSKNLTEINYYYDCTEKAVEFHSFLPSVLEGVYLRAPVALLLGKETLVQLNRLRVSQSHSGRLVQKKNFVSTGIRTAAHPSLWPYSYTDYVTLASFLPSIPLLYNPRRRKTLIRSARVYRRIQLTARNRALIGANMCSTSQ